MSKIDLKRELAFEPWVPLEGIPFPIYVEGFHDDYEGMRILFRGEALSDRMLRIKFLPLAYRSANESNLLQTGFSGGAEKGKSLFVVENSDFMDWFLFESSGVHKREELTQYSIATPDDCYDIIVKSTPIAEWL